MATQDIMKQAVFDQRIVQLPARYAVDKGALSVTNAPYNAIAASTSQHTYNINVPSQNVFVDRAVDWACDVLVNFTVDYSGNPLTPGANAIVVRPGYDFALAAFPLHEMTQTMTATINDTSVIINTDTVLHEVLRLTDYKKNRLVRHCPTMLDRYAKYQDAGLAINNPISGYLNATDSAEVPNGAWYGLEFVIPAGVTSVTPTTYVTNGATIDISSGLPVNTSGASSNNQYLIGIKFSSQEKLVLSPFVFADSAEWETGLFGVNNIQLVMNMKSDFQRLLRWTGAGSGAVNKISGISVASFPSAKVNVQYLTPSLDLPLPAKSVVPYMEFPRYITTATAPGAVGAFQISSQTIVLPQIPDYLLIFAKPKATQTGAYGDWHFPITSINLNFDNFAGLLSSHTAQQLYQMSVHNGLQMDFNEWIGKAWSGGLYGVAATQAPIQTVGGFLVLKPGQDFGLQSGQAPSLIGNFTLQFTVTCQNYFAANNAIEPQLYVVAVNSGFFETLAGSSRIIKGVLSEADIISAEPVMEMSRDGLNRMVGTGFFSNLGSMLSKAVDIYTKTKPMVSGLKGILPESGALGKVKGALQSVGYGVAGASMPSGAGKKSLSQRLM